MAGTRFKTPPEEEKSKKSSSSVYSKISASVFLSVLAAGTFYMNFFERTEVSQNEKRELTKFPEFSLESYFSGEYTSTLDKWYTDTIPNRDTLTSLSGNVESLRGISVTPKFYGNVSKVEKSDKVETETAEEPIETEIVTEAPKTEETEVNDVSETTVTTASETETETTVTEEETFDGNIGDFLNNGIITNGIEMYGEQAGIMLYGGNDPEGLHYANVINAYREALDDNINIYTMVIPTSAEFYLPKKFSAYNASEKDGIDYIYENITGNVTKLDVYQTLSEHTDEYIYFRTDHHWTGLGAYYAYTTFCEAAGLPYHDLEDYEMRTKENFVGSLYNYTNDSILKKSPETFNYYVPPESYTAEGYDGKTMRDLGPTSLFHEYAEGGNLYGLFLGGDNMHIIVNTENNTGRKLVIFKDSYGNALSPYFVSSFDEIYIIDIRYFGKNSIDYINSIGATDVLFADNIFAANTGTLVSDIENLMNK